MDEKQDLSAAQESKPSERGEVYDEFDDLGELDALEELDGLDELDELALNANQQDFAKDSLMGIPGDVPIDSELLRKLENIKEKKPIPRQTSDSKADDEHLRYYSCLYEWVDILLSTKKFKPVNSPLSKAS